MYLVVTAINLTFLQPIGDHLIFNNRYFEVMAHPEVFWHNVSHKPLTISLGLQGRAVHFIVHKC